MSRYAPVRASTKARHAALYAEYKELRKTLRRDAAWKILAEKFGLSFEHVAKICSCYNAR